MDFRTFFGKTKTETKTETKTYTEEQMKVMVDEGYREGYKAAEEDLCEDGWEFEPSLDELADNHPPMTKWVGGICLHRYPTKEEREEVLHPGQVLFFPVCWNFSDPHPCIYEERRIPLKEWVKGERWTLERVWGTAKSIYSSSRKRAVKAMGDHRFWEGISANGAIMVGS